MCDVQGHDVPSSPLSLIWLKDSQCFQFFEVKLYFSVLEKRYRSHCEDESYNSKLFWVKPKMIARYHLLGHPYMFHVEAESRCVCISVPGN